MGIQPLHNSHAKVFRPEQPQDWICLAGIDDLEASMLRLVNSWSLWKQQNDSLNIYKCCAFHVICWWSYESGVLVKDTQGMAWMLRKLSVVAVQRAPLFFLHINPMLPNRLFSKGQTSAWYFQVHFMVFTIIFKKCSFKNKLLQLSNDKFISNWA